MLPADKEPHQANLGWPIRAH